MAKFFGIVLAESEISDMNVTTPFRITSVALDGGNSAKLYVTVDEEKFLVATLNRKITQIPVDLHFACNEHIKFENMGCGNLSLLGYFLPELQDHSLEYEVKTEVDMGQGDNGELPNLSSPVGVYQRSNTSSDMNDPENGDSDSRSGSTSESGDEEDELESNEYNAD